MTQDQRNRPDAGLSRRRVLTSTALGGALALGAPALLKGVPPVRAQAVDQESLQQANIDWRQAEGEQITVGLTPAGYFENLIAVAPAFEELTGVGLRFEKIPPGEIRQKIMLDLSTGTGTYATHAADPMYYPLYVANGWVDPLDQYLEDSDRTDAAWFQYEDILEGWRGVTTVEGTPYAIPFDGEATVQVYRTDAYDRAGIQPAETLDEYVANAAEVHDPDNRLWGAALRGFRGAGQNMYIYPSIFRAYGGEWFDGDGKLVVNSEEGVAALEWYVQLLNTYAPSGVENWNWPDLADAFGQGILGSYIDAHSSAAVINSPEKSKVIGKIGFARWPKGPSGKRVTSIWNWSFPINAALSDEQKTGTWLFIQWAASREVQEATSYKFDGAYKRTGVNRTSVWNDPAYRELMAGFGRNFVEATVTSLAEDTDVDWRPRIPQWPAVGDFMATAVQAALVGQASPKESLDQAQKEIDKVMAG